MRGFKEFNLIVTHLPGRLNKRLALRELRLALGRVSVVYSAPNILYCLTEDPHGAVRRLREKLTRRTSILRVIPVDRVVEARLDAVRDAVVSLMRSAPEGSYAIRLDGRLLDSEGRPVPRDKAIEFLASPLKRPVDLRDPDVLVYVKVSRVGGRRVASIYVGPPTGILSAVKELR